ncbi:MAG TPA: hypothetical protein VFP65_17940 [Anaeromyxobacteraceae bacterium]|nr:hypothetical protein [Anaeromyxobacteraceae bacterium]
MSPPARLLAAATLLAAAGCGPARIETDPPSVRLFGRGQQARVHATPLARNGRALTDPCRWSSTDEKVAAVEARHNDATVTARGHGRANVLCAIGGASAVVPVTVTVVARVEVSPSELSLRVTDEPAPTALTVRALDAEGQEVQGRTIATRCLDENVCRGDARGQVWPVAAGSTTLKVTVEDGEADVPVKVADARTAAGRPRAVKGNPMEGIDAPPPAPRKGR